MKDQAQWRWSVTLRYITERGFKVFNRPGNSADLTPIEMLHYEKEIC